MTDRTLYDAGWDDCIEYINDKRKLQLSQTGWGYLLMVLGSVFAAFTVSIPIMMWFTGTPIYHYSPLIWTGVTSTAMLVAGYFIGKKDVFRYEQRKAAFNNKWFTRWDELGFRDDKA